MSTEFNLPHILTGGRLLRSNTMERRKNLALNHSPTDRLMSPCTRLLHGKRRHSPASVEKRTAQQWDIQSAVIPVPFPGGDLEFILGTSSASRKNIVNLLKWKYTQMSPDIDEKAIRCDDPHQMPLKIAQAKAAALVERLKSENRTEPALLLTADQIVLFQDTVREKPSSAEEATQFLSSYSENAVQTLSAISLTHFPSGLQTSTVHTATVRWKEIPTELVERLVAEGEVMHSAGGFLVEHEAMQPLIDRVENGVDSVMGLPVSATICLMDELQDLVTQSQCEGGDSETDKTEKDGETMKSSEVASSPSLSLSIDVSDSSPTH